MARLGTRFSACLAASVVSLSLVSVGAPGHAVSSGVVEHGRQLPAIPEAEEFTGSLALAGGTVYAGLRSTADVYAPTIVYRTAADGTSGWSAVVDPDTGEPLTADPMEADGPTILVDGPQLADTPCADYRVIEPGLARSFESCSTPSLGRGDGLLARRSVSSWVVDDIDGSSSMSVPTEPAVEGSTAWTYSAGTVKGLVVPTGATSSVRSIPGGCTPGGFGGAAGGYALLPCQYQGRAAVVDVEGSLPPWPLLGVGWSLGDGFAVQSTTLDGVPVVHVVDLGQGKAERWFQRSSAMVAVDHGSAAQVVYQVSDTTLEVADLGPLAARTTAPEDVVAPSVGVTGPAAVVRAEPAGSARLDWSWSGADPGHGTALTYEWRTAEYYRGEPLVWGPAPTGFALTSYFSTAGAGRFTCLQVRARDWAGNVSDWVGTPCTYVDGSSPGTSITSGARPPALPLPPDQLAGTPLVLAYAATDDDQVASYDVDARTALPGQGWSAWSGQSTPATSVSRLVPAGAAACYRVRARDRAGNVGDYSTEWCASMPYDDRALERRGHARRVTAAGALGRTATRLPARGALLRAGVVARAVWVRVLGHPLGCPAVWIGGQRIARSTCYQFADGPDTWVEVTNGAEHRGTLKVRSSWGPIKVDAVAIGR